MGLILDKKKAQLKMFSAIQVTPSLSPAFRSENRKASLQDLISLNILGTTNKKIVYCQGFFDGTGIAGWVDDG